MRLFSFAALLLAASLACAQGYEQRDDVQAFIADMEARHGLDAAALAALFAGVAPNPAVIAAVEPPADPSVRSWQRYRARFIEPRRVREGLRFWRRYAKTLARAEKRYGVPREIIVAIIGVETFYGARTGRFDVLRALTTLAFDYPPRAELFRTELESLLLLAREQGRAVSSYRGSYAGALGLPQFLPSSERAWGVDFNGDGRVDLNNAVDAIGSVAHFLNEHGWQAGEPVALAVEVAGDVADLLSEGIAPRRLPAEMPGVAAKAAPALPAALIDLTSPDAATEYWLGYRNFYALTRYNRSSFYAMTVFQLAQKLRAAMKNS